MNAQETHVKVERALSYPQAKVTLPRGDYALGLRTQPRHDIEWPDYARGARTLPHELEGPDYARGLRTLPRMAEGPDFARGLRQEQEKSG